MGAVSLAAAKAEFEHRVEAGELPPSISDLTSQAARSRLAR
jgi:hypothetical protein